MTPFGVVAHTASKPHATVVLMRMHAHVGIAVHAAGIEPQLEPPGPERQYCVAGSQLVHEPASMRRASVDASCGSLAFE